MAQLALALRARQRELANLHLGCTTLTTAAQSMGIVRGRAKGRLNHVFTDTSTRAACGNRSPISVAGWLVE